MIPNNFINDTRLDVYEFRVLCYLLKLADNNLYCYPSYETIVNETGMSKSKAISSIKALISYGYIVKECRENSKKEHFSNCYTLSIGKSEEQENSDEDVMDIVVSETEGGVCETEGGVCETEGSVCETEGSVCETEGSVCETEGSVCETHNQYIYTNNHNTNTHYTNQSTMCLEELMDRLDEYELKGELKRVFEKAIEVMYTSNSITVGGEDIPRDKVRKRLENLTLEHIAAVDRNKPMCLIDGKPVSNVNNPIAYTVTALYNSLAFTEEEIIDMEYGGT